MKKCANRHMKKCSASSGKCKSKSQGTITLHSLDLYCQKETNNKCWWWHVEKGILVNCWWVCKLVQPQWKIVWRFFRKLKIELPMLGMYPKKMKTLIQKDICTSVFMAPLFILPRYGNNLCEYNFWKNFFFFYWFELLLNN